MRGQVLGARESEREGGERWQLRVCCHPATRDSRHGPGTQIPHQRSSPSHHANNQSKAISALAFRNILTSLSLNSNQHSLNPLKSNPNGKSEDLNWAVNVHIYIYNPPAPLQRYKDSRMYEMRVSAMFPCKLHVTGAGRLAADCNQIPSKGPAQGPPVASPAQPTQ